MLNSKLFENLQNASKCFWTMKHTGVAVDFVPTSNCLQRFNGKIKILFFKTGKEYRRLIKPTRMHGKEEIENKLVSHSWAFGPQRTKRNVCAPCGTLVWYIWSKKDWIKTNISQREKTCWINLPLIDKVGMLLTTARTGNHAGDQRWHPHWVMGTGRKISHWVRSDQFADD